MLVASDLSSALDADPELDLDRYNSLIASGSISKQQYDAQKSLRVHWDSVAEKWSDDVKRSFEEKIWDIGVLGNCGEEFVNKLYSQIEVLWS